MKVVSFFSYKSLRGFIDGYLAAHFPVVSKLLNRHKTGVKYLFAGGTAAAVNLMLLYVLTDIIGVWYLTSSVVAFIASFITSFVLQKFWTFRDPGLGRIKKQFAIYIVLGAINFFSGPALLYVFVEVFHIWYLFGQVLAMGLLAAANYFINKFVTFKKDSSHESVNV
ncbi:MAG: hypothetical protein A3H70_03890 [Candidatus Komeilibacteria bacterium RIFCSPLOWO2_02_FULL_48_11]|uniref:GtrA/DPMS transmembrane domain-containing protein n=1 Tax=Candidatus Komeilibacteria bacterium RIFCSPLOWO2_02_FULL_48_11 TaxID=1798553 RepID=A0A1G2BNY2_9BACT|nr:MAG: hypothetical protein A3H70_03890 [Candidatus Komeilibacteria bacterium RIFCSPLOWO2_02_FULL_48_11]